MSNNSHDPFDVLVVGAGPAGLAAAARVADCGKRVGIVDDNAEVGGQIWRKAHRQIESCELIRRFLSKFVLLCGRRVFDHPAPSVLLVEGLDDICELRYEKLILATGARERFLPFPGWTLPNVMGAGGLQAMVKSGLPIRGKRIVIAGTGPLLLAVAAYLKKQGAEILLICEQASWSALAGFSIRLAGYTEKIKQGMQLRKQLAGIPFAASSWPVAARGSEKLESVTISRNDKLQEIACDYLACGFHLVPNVELALLLGCELNGGYVKVDEFQQTTVNNVLCAGEPTGIGGLESALVEGQIAGLAAVGETKRARELFGERRKAEKFRRMLDRTFVLRPELKDLPKAETIVCRCEDVTYSRLERYSSWRAAKLHTRCGMGPCQGRVCGPATKFLFGWNPDSVRPPIFPARVYSLIASGTATDMGG
jgi:D-hydroxyproline dehydrogenase subunit alpha